MNGFSSVINRKNNLIGIVILIVALLNLGWRTAELLPESFVEQTAAPMSEKVPLLLNSGLTQSNEAEFSLILWFEKGEIPQKIWTELPIKDWVWTSNTLRTEDGQEAKTLFGQHLVNKNEENILFTWYTTMAQEVSKAGGKIYLDERVPKMVDVSAYLSQVKARPLQCSYLGNMVSIAAYKTNLGTDVRAGKDRINIQLLSRGKSTEGQSVLAMPALLEEF